METTILNYNTPTGRKYISKKDNIYYIDGTEYKEDVEMLERCIKRIRLIDLNHANKLWREAKSMEEYFQVTLDFQYSHGGLIGIPFPSVMWREELARRGKLNCDKCGQKMVMYYSPTCLVCDTSRIVYPPREMVNAVLIKRIVERDKGENAAQRVWDYFCNFEFSNDSYQEISKPNYNNAVDWYKTAWEAISDAYKQVTGKEIEDSVIFHFSW